MKGWPLLIGVEAAASVLGFLGVARLAARLGPEGFGPLEFGLALSAWWLILVRGGFEAAVTREAARDSGRIDHLQRVMIVGRLVLAGCAYTAVVLIGACSGRPVVAATCGLSLFVAAVAPDLAARARGDLGRLALVSATRGALVAALSFAPWTASTAPLLFTAAEIGAVAAFAAGRRKGTRLSLTSFAASLPEALSWIRATLGATSARFARVAHYASDIAFLGLVAAPELGTYAAARRLLFAALGLAVVIPGAALGPLAAAARTGRFGDELARHAARLALLLASMSVALAIAATAGLDRLLGPRFAEAGPILAVVALRLPPLALTALGQTALTAAGRDAATTRHAWGSLVLAVAFAALGRSVGGATGFAWGFVAAESLALAALVVTAAPAAARRARRAAA